MKNTVNQVWLLLGVFLSGASHLQALADGSNCSTIEECERIQSEAAQHKAQLIAEWRARVAPKFVGPVMESDPACTNDGFFGKDEDSADTICRMSLKDAKAYCENQGLRLPTTREWAAYAISQGVPNIKETGKPGIPYYCGENPACAAQGGASDYYTVNSELIQEVYDAKKTGHIPNLRESQWAHGSVDFYFSNYGYKMGHPFEHARGPGFADARNVFWTSTPFVEEEGIEHHPIEHPYLFDVSIAEFWAKRQTDVQNWVYGADLGFGTVCISK